MRRYPDRYGQYRRIALRMADQDPILAMIFFETVFNGFRFQGDQRCEGFLDCLEALQSAGQETYRFMKDAPPALLKVEDAYVERVVKIAALLSKNRTEQINFLEEVQSSLKLLRSDKDLVLEATQRLAEKDGSAAYDFFMHYSPRLVLLNTGPALTTERLLLHYIHDLQSARAVSKAIDLQKYGKEYAETVGKFY
jgi:hypothetical protein